MPSRGTCLFWAAVLGVVPPAAARGAAPPTEAPKTYEVQAIKDLTYYDGPGAHPIKHKLDVYVPRGRKDFPVLFFAHGGAWVHGDKGFLGIYQLLATAYARRGIGVVVTNYRLSPSVAHPEHARDVARAVAWTVRNIARYGGRPDALFLCGHSAGAHLVSLVTADAGYLKEHGLTSRAIRGVIPISGPFLIPDRFLPRVFGTDPEVRKKASPITHARGGLPPFFILYADKDLPGCDRRPCEAFCEALKEKGTRAVTLEVAGSDHLRILASAGNASSRVFQDIVAFIRANQGN